MPSFQTSQPDLQFDTPAGNIPACMSTRSDTNPSAKAAALLTKMPFHSDKKAPVHNDLPCRQTDRHGYSIRISIQYHLLVTFIIAHVVFLVKLIFRISVKTTKQVALFLYYLPIIFEKIMGTSPSEHPITQSIRSDLTMIHLRCIECCRNAGLKLYNKSQQHHCIIAVDIRRIRADICVCSCSAGQVNDIHNGPYSA